MKPTSMVMVVLVILVGQDFAAANGEQVAWRWRNDDGGAYSATWKDSINTPVVLTQYGNIRLRILDKVGTANSSTISLRYTEDLFNGSWVPITGVDTGKFFISPSQYLTDTMSYVDNQLFPPFYSDHWYRRTITFDSSISYLLVADTNSLYELEYSLKPTPTIQPGSAYFFSLFMDTTLMHSWDPWEFAVLLTPPVNWSTHSINLFGWLTDVSFVDVNNGIAIGYGYNGGVGMSFKTTDGGRTWVEQSLPSSMYASSVDFADAKIGIIVGSAGRILRTTDGGQSWLSLASAGSTAALHRVRFSDGRHGTIVGGGTSGGGIIMRTTDSGETWVSQSCPTYRRIRAASFPLPDIGCAVGEAGTILTTTNGGQSWLGQSSGTAGDLNDVWFTDSYNGTAVGGNYDTRKGFILRTTDGGRAWRKAIESDVPMLSTVCFTNSSTGWVAGEYGWILKTTDGGSSWKKVTSGTYRSLSSIHFVDSNNGWAVGELGTVLATTSGDETSVDHRQTDRVPTEYFLSQNYPNPFNPSTTIRYGLPQRSHVTLTVFNTLGQEVAELVNGEVEAGYHEVRFDASGLSSGVYFYRLTAGDFVETKKLVLVH